MAEGDFPKSDGDDLFASEVNYLNNGKIKQVYTGTDLDIAGTITTNTHELTAITDPKDAAHVLISIKTFLDMTWTTGTAPESRIGIEIKEIGNSYSFDFAKQKVLKIGGHTAGDEQSTELIHDLEWFIELTAGQASNGFQIRITYETNVTNINMANKQIVQRLS